VSLVGALQGSVMGGDVLFSALERWQENRPWGRFLDAGTGVNSLIWVQGLETLSWDAITADTNMKREIQSHSEIKLRPQDSLLVGNWMDDKFCQDLGKYDTILADYLIGAVDGFSPYTQDLVIERCETTLSLCLPFSLSHTLSPLSPLSPLSLSLSHTLSLSVSHSLVSLLTFLQTKGALESWRVFVYNWNEPDSRHLHATSEHRI
jgi:hypothetical protein